MKKKLMAIATTALLVAASAMPASAARIDAPPSGMLIGSFQQPAWLDGRTGYTASVTATVYGAYRPRTSIAEYIELRDSSTAYSGLIGGGASTTAVVSAPTGYVPIEGSGEGTKSGYYNN